MWVVELCKGVWLAPWKGDPGRTLEIRSARKYDTERGARVALGLAKKFRPFEGAKVYEVEVITTVRKKKSGVKWD